MNAEAMSTFRKKMTFYSHKLKMPFGEVVNKVIQSLTQQGFIVTHTLDLHDTFRKRLGLEFRNYSVLGVYNPLLACKAVALESDAGVMLSCNVVIQESANGETEISAFNPLESIAPDQQTRALADITQEIGVRLRAAVDFIAHASRQPGDATKKL